MVPIVLFVESRLSRKKLDTFRVAYYEHSCIMN